VSRITPAMRRVLFEFNGGDRLHGCDDENGARRLHLALTSFLCWIAFMEFLVIPLFSARKVAMESLALVLGGATAGALALVRRGRKRAAALLFLSVLWCLQWRVPRAMVKNTADMVFRRVLKIYII
jgi:hypothetical protein